MKTFVTYGFYMALAGFVLNLLFYFAGFHTDPAKLSSTQWISSVVLLILGITITALGIRARRSEIPVTENFGYGRALGTGVMITLFACLFGIVTTFIYMKLINPGFTDVMVQAQLDKLEAKGLSSTQIEKAEGMIRTFMHPAAVAGIGFLMGMFWGTIISLVEAAILKRPAVEEPIVTA